MQKINSHHLMTEQLVSLEILDVAHWRKRFHTAYEGFANLYELQDMLAKEDDVFAGPRGYVRLQGIKANRASIQTTAKAVQIMERERPATQPNA